MAQCGITTLELKGDEGKVGERKRKSTFMRHGYKTTALCVFKKKVPRSSHLPAQRPTHPPPSKSPPLLCMTTKSFNPVPLRCHSGDHVLSDGSKSVKQLGLQPGLRDQQVDVDLRRGRRAGGTVVSQRTGIE